MIIFRVLLLIKIRGILILIPIMGRIRVRMGERVMWGIGILWLIRGILVILLKFC